MLDWIQMGLLVAALITIFVSSYWSSKTIKETQKHAKRQYEFQFFAEYTRRYQDIILHMPDNDKDPRWLKYVQLYFDLCSEEYHLHEEGV